jgi:hypothetical protein
VSASHSHHGHSHGHGDPHGSPTWLNLSLAVILGVAAIVAGVTAWRGTVLNGHAVENFTLSTQSVNDANSLAQEAERASTSERALFVNYQEALANGDTARADAIYSMMDGATRRAIEWWRAQPAGDRPLTPFKSANPDWAAPSTVIDARDALDRASEQLAQANVDLDKSHSLEFIAALLTVTFLLGGLSGVFQSQRAKTALVTASGTALGVCLLAMVLLW